MKYRCHLCKHEEEVAGSATDGPIIVHSRILDVTAKYESSLVKNMADAEIRHVRKMHSGTEGQKK